MTHVGCVSRWAGKTSLDPERIFVRPTYHVGYGDQFLINTFEGGLQYGIITIARLAV